MAIRGRDAEIGKLKRQGSSGANKQEPGDLGRPALGSHEPRQKPKATGATCAPQTPGKASSELGPPLSIRQVAHLIGCCPWTVRQKWIPKGMPHVRTAGASGKFIFFEREVIAWLRKQQGGTTGGSL